MSDGVARNSATAPEHTDAPINPGTPYRLRGLVFYCAMDLHRGVFYKRGDGDEPASELVSKRASERAVESCCSSWWRVV